MWAVRPKVHAIPMTNHERRFFPRSFLADSLQRAHRVCAAVLAIALVLAWVPPSFARGEWPDSPHKAWFQNLQRPDNHLNPHRDEKSRYCCGIADVVDTKFKVESTGGQHPDDVWYAWLNEAWVRIPSEKIIDEFAPNGRAYLFMLAGTIQCFVKPKGGL
jgi:hypothetical protein